jgi:L-ascorbate metabolism protein UlaG (beta-lactamase superfamily)
LIAWGVEREKVRQFDCGRARYDGVQFTATPAQHFSGRGVFDGNSTLWSSWVIVDDALARVLQRRHRLLRRLQGDRRRFGPFDVTLLETGAYDAQWPYVHMQPEHTVQAHEDLRGQWLMPIHNGTFDLAMHGWQDPFERVLALSDARGIALTTPRMGDAWTSRPARGQDVGGAAWKRIRSLQPWRKPDELHIHGCTKATARVRSSTHCSRWTSARASTSMHRREHRRDA